MRTLYICYFGLREPLVQTQVLPYLRQLSDGGIDVSLLTFEPKKHSWSPQEAKEWREKLEADGIRWFSLRYHKRPSLPATLYDVAVGVWYASRLARRNKIDVFHARSHVAATIGAVAKRLNGGRLIFDIRGFMPEEYTDGGIWPAGGRLYRWTKAAERRLLRAADGFVVLTDRARSLLFPDCTDLDLSARPVEVIPCCVDLARFEDAADFSKEQVRSELGLTGRRVLVYVGALGGWYLTNDMAQFLATAHQQDKSTFSLILTQSQPEQIEDLLRDLGVSNRDYLIRQVRAEQIPWYLKAADAGLSFIKPCFSKQASSPTKIAEYLAGGLPIISNAGIGDLDQVIADDGVGVIVSEFNREAYLEALTKLANLLDDDDLANRCRASARVRFDLERVGGARYLRLYRRLLEHEKTAPVISQVVQ